MESNTGFEKFEFHIDNNETQFETLKAERSAMPTFGLAQPLDLASVSSETAARRHVYQFDQSTIVPSFILPVINGIKSELKILGSEIIPFTNTKIVKFRQTLNKIPLYGSLITIELNMDNEFRLISSHLGKPTNVDPVAKISPADALNIAKTKAGHGQKPFESTPRLFYYHDKVANRWRLIYVIEDVPVISTSKPKQEDLPKRKGNHKEFCFHSSNLLMDYLIDAHTGDIVAELPRTPSMASNSVILQEKDGLGIEREIQCLNGPDGSLILYDERYNVHTHDFKFQDIELGLLPGNYAVNPPSPWETGAVSAHANAVAVAQFLHDVLQRNGIDNMGSPIMSSINCVWWRGSIDAQQWANAAWVNKQMVYGQRMMADGQLRSYAVSLDIVAHEFFHGVTDQTARLEYIGETGALNESYSDIFGIIISNMHNPNILQWNWEMGEELDATGLPIRNMRNPMKFGQPDHWNKYQNLPLDENNDNGGVHINSGIHNKAAYNIMTSTDAAGQALFSASEVAILFYITLTQFLSRTSSFIDSYKKSLLVGRTLFNDDPKKADKLNAIKNGFNNVGII